MTTQTGRAARQELDAAMSEAEFQRELRKQNHLRWNPTVATPRGAGLMSELQVAIRVVAAARNAAFDDGYDGEIRKG